jgi:hypothetical protein
MFSRPWIKARIDCRSGGGTHHGYKEWLFKNVVGIPMSGETIAANVKLYYDSYTDTIRVQLYSTVILLFTPDGRFWADDGGFATPTTTYRLNQFGPPDARFWRENGHLRCTYGQCSQRKFMGEPSTAKIVVVPPVVQEIVVTKTKIVKVYPKPPMPLAGVPVHKAGVKKRRTIRRTEVEGVEQRKETGVPVDRRNLLRLHVPDGAAVEAN